MWTGTTHYEMVAPFEFTFKGSEEGLMRYVRIVVLCAALAGTYAIVAGTLGGCGSGNDKCDSCNPDESKCDNGLECLEFSDGIPRCANAGDTCKGLGLP